MRRLVIYAVDVGSVRGERIGWARRRATREVKRVQGGAEAAMKLAAAVAADLRKDRSVALGFEAPLWVPAAPIEAPEVMSAARSVERSLGRPWSAGAGASVLSMGLVQVDWLLRSIGALLPSPLPPAFLDWTAFEASGHGLFLWEALVTGVAKAPKDDARHDAEDAVTAIQAFRRWRAADASPPSGPVVSLVGAALVRTGWSTDVALLSTPCRVVVANRQDRESPMSA